ncbi:hypothetical protein DYB37_007768 [Aphanomyces astaci]|uniref:Protein kinase domain-containing protein n=1 Tax=Aphanomyces astaci TaxID=112090 RepID=A0A3R7BH27_APHAT|nr:hypothetical protein DYB37_007768 [Aphanomyces astaci]
MLAKGTILKNWVVGDKLGSGACSDVYAVTSKSNSAESFAMKLSPIPPPSKSKKKTHAARSADALYAEHLLYVNTLQGIPGIPALPTSGAYGEDKGYRFLVIQRLGRTLEQVKTANGGTLPESTVARLGLEIVYCVDFGIAERYNLVTGAHKPYKTGAVVGTPTFSSTSSTASKRAKSAASTIAPALAKGRTAAAVDLSAAKTSASSSPTDDGKENKATSVKKGGVKRKDPPSSTKTPPQPDVVDVDLEKKRKEPSERRKKAASRAVGALAAASAAVTRARRTRSTTQAELQ